MNAIADEFAASGVGSYFLYTNEAHPGEHYPQLSSMEEKHQHARALVDVYGVTRPILIDGLGGACHRAYGTMPNMTWIFSRSGAALYKSDWTHSESVRQALIYLLDVGARRRQRVRLTPFRVEKIEYREQDPERFNEGLARNGPRAVTEFRDAFR